MRFIVLSVCLIAGAAGFPSLTFASSTEFIVGFLQLKKSDGLLRFRMKSGGAEVIRNFADAQSVVPCTTSNERSFCAISFDQNGIVASTIDENFPNEEGFEDAGWGSVGISENRLIIRFRADSAQTLMDFVKKDSSSVICKTKWGQTKFRGSRLFQFKFCEMSFESNQSPSATPPGVE